MAVAVEGNLSLIWLVLVEVAVEALAP